MVHRGTKVPHPPILLHNSYSSFFNTAPASTVVRFREPRGLQVARDVEGNCLDPKAEERIRWSIWSRSSGNTKRLADR